MTDRDLHRYLVRRVSPESTYENLLQFPRYFEIETVNACNARCPMCTIDDWTRQTPVMRMDLFRKIADEISQNADSVQRVSLYRDGEPLLDKKLPDRIAILKDGGVRQVTISTNVGLLNEARAQAILEAGIDLVILSIDSLQKDIYEAIRVRLVHEEVMENAMRFIALRDRIRPSCRIWVRMIRQESNYGEWPEFEAFWRSRLGPDDRVNFHLLHNWGDQLTGFKAVAPSFEPKLPCVALWSLMVIFGNGDVPLCNVDYNNKFPTGSVATQSIAEVWQSAIAMERRRMHLSGDKARLPVCGNCNVWDEPPDKEDRIAAEYADAPVAIPAAE